MHILTAREFNPAGMRQDSEWGHMQLNLSSAAALSKYLEFRAVKHGGQTTALAYSRTILPFEAGADR